MDQGIIEEVVIGAEAVVYIQAHSVVKKRVPKKYRTAELDIKLRKGRTKLEATIQSDARKAGVPTPIIREVNGFDITMERVEGHPVSLFINETIAEQIGEVLCTLHSAGIAHGDPTTRNMIVSNTRIYLIDFGLASYDRSLEARGVDVHVFFQSLEALHEDYRTLKKAFLAGYGKKCRDVEQIMSKVGEIERRGRYL
ncbi:MAG: Kae1-associated kinase Bud32 [Euryarchaeota archaeon]|nr:Kae1-associated kinase Bud32 [Euryarchaeota archaeon]